MKESTTLLELATVLAAGIGMQWVAWRLRLPSILLLLVAGLAVGPLARLGLGHALVNPDELLGPLLLPVTSVSVALILFEGGLSLQWVELDKVGRVVWSLVTVGALVRWLLVAALTWGLGLLELRLALLFGAILVVTGPTVIGPLLEHVRPRGAVGTILRWEGIVIDPIGATLAVLVYEVISADVMTVGVVHAAVGLARTAVVGTAVGAAAAAALVTAIRRLWLPDSLENAVTLMLVVVAFVASNSLQHESGLLAVTVMGVGIGNALRGHADRIIEFKETLRGILISCLFVLIAARVDLASLVDAIGWRSVVFFVALVLVVRPAGVFVSTLGSALSWQERAFVAGLAPRGIVAAAVSAVFALRLAEHGFPRAQDLATLTFVVIIGTVAVYGLCAGPLARALRLSTPDPQGLLIVGAHDWARAIAEAIQRAGAAVTLIDSNGDNVARARTEGLHAVRTSALSQAVHDQVDLSGIGHCLALTANDEVNTLAGAALRSLVGRGRTLQISPRRKGATPVLPASVALSGLTFDEVGRLRERGAEVRATKLTEAFKEEQWRATHGPEAVPIAVLDGQGRLTIIPAGASDVAKPGETLVGLVLPRPAPEETVAPAQGAVAG